MSLIRYREHEFQLLQDESVLEGLLRRGILVPFSCRSGSCHVCMMRATGDGIPAAAQKGLHPRLQARGYFLPCACAPQADLTISDPDPEDLRLDALVVEKQQLAENIFRIRLEPALNLTPLPGQHIAVVHPSGVCRPYSVASLPEEDYYLDLHVGRSTGGLVSNWLIDSVHAGDMIGIQRPSGSFALGAQTDGMPLLLLATGTGIAPMLPILRDTLKKFEAREVWVFHGMRSRAGLYAHEVLNTLARQHSNLHYHGCCSGEEVAAPLLHGRVTDIALDMLPNLTDFTVMIAGNPHMVADARSRCRHAGAKDEDILCDAFHHAHMDTAEKAPAGAANRSVPDPDPQLWSALDEGRILREVLEDFYARAFADARLGPYFSGVTQSRLVEKQYSFLRSLIAGTRDYLGQRPRNAHHWMVISDELFDYRLSIMEACMRAHGVGSPWLQRWHAYEEAFRGDIVKATPARRVLHGMEAQPERFETAIIDSGTLCDGCGAAIEPGERVRFHSRLGTTYCRQCTGAEDVAQGG
jgi:ferredoxin-NADP reductase/ferredoxin/truncated hemoglobin YjbI